ncbi:MAG TPA: hypothetical protein DCQ26_17360 [Marinilabiliales bacterium]|nr:MAG: hypothetical protein A2W96_13400 [Bacteroidetes bacterium GWD2_40_43]OFX91961.1 MAG: hypothetical protein A2W97_15710 [Bacteroidetes bacterium GWE2_40_63]OFY24622.1 MAG: hypothetical protein A2W88_11075 [Bacteroidetes bacterium GWF2_40_13]OFZ26864.1 MAG: hypothetical protein A2437_08240 [Bacteroidetes bacterium RIFOXYC2_FULL_40_12]HAN00366.1 hypothetical protein [Marinilabiliales bacterium]
MEHHPYKPLNPLWLKAAVVGSIWASIEIVLGSFLHNLRVPLSGTMLSFIAVYLLVTFSHIWNDKGLILRAGVITALMKSISPSAIILGPMTGILAEAFLLELFLRLVGRNRLGFLMGGAFAVFSALLHKIISLLLIYGSDVVKILSLLYQYATKQLHLESLENPWHALWVLAIVYLAAGMVAAWLGCRMSRKILRSPELDDSIGLSFKKERQLFAQSSVSDKYAMLHVALHLLIIIGALLLLNKAFYISSLFIGTVYLTFCFIYYKHALRRLTKISVWFQFIAITLLASILWNGFSQHNFYPTEGAAIGLKMIFRAMLVMVGFSVIGTELKNPSIKSILYSRGFKNIYHALDLSFSALPDLLTHMTPREKKVENYKGLLVRFFRNAQSLLQSFTNEDRQKPSVLIISGETHRGKTTYSQKLVSLMLEQNMPLTGFLTVNTTQKAEEPSYAIKLLPRNGELPFIESEAREHWIKFRKYYFNTDIFQKGMKHVEAGISATSKFVILDEIGPLEMENKGWSPLIEQLCTRVDIFQIWVVRRHLVPLVIKKWDVGHVYIADIEHDKPEDCLKIVN